MLGIAKQPIYGGRNRVPIWVVWGNDGSPVPVSNVSNDGITWVQSSDTTDITAPLDLLTGRGRLVRMGGGTTGDIIAQYSLDGTHWFDSNLTDVANQDPTGSAYGNGTFVITFESLFSTFPPNYAWSIDGVTWTSSSLPNTPVDNNRREVSFGSGYFVAPASRSTFPPYITTLEFSAPGRASWSSATLPLSNKAAWVAFSGNNRFFVAPGTGTFTGYESTNQGSSWTTRTFTGGNFLANNFGNGVYLSAGGLNTGTNVLYGATYYLSSNGYQWTSQANTLSLERIIFYNGLFVGVNGTGETVATSSDLVTWTTLTTTAPIMSGVYAIAIA